MKVFKEVLRKNRSAILLCFVIDTFQLTVFQLYNVMTEPLLYASTVSLLLLGGLLAIDYFREKNHRVERMRTADSIAREKAIADSLAQVAAELRAKAVADSIEKANKKLARKGKRKKA